MPVGARGIPRTIFPIFPFSTSFPPSSTILTSKPGIGFPALPGFIRKLLHFSVESKFVPVAASCASPVMGDPDSEDHQLSTTNASSAPYFSRRR